MSCRPSGREKVCDAKSRKKNKKIGTVTVTSAFLRGLFCIIVLFS